MYEGIGTRIKTLLEKKNMLQRQLADRIGVTEVTISRYCSGMRTPGSIHLFRIAEELGTTPEWILFGDEYFARCPFCGSAEVKITEIPYEDRSGNPYGFIPSCARCKKAVIRMESGRPDYFKDTAEARRVWNERGKGDA